jgi:diacylglycerol kinase family enzyme
MTTAPSVPETTALRPSIVAFVNQRSGGQASSDTFGELLDELQITVRAIEPDSFDDALREEISAGTDVVAVLGGDGTVRSAAAVLAGSSTALLAMPGGTRNHFAKIVGTADVDAVRLAITSGHDIPVPLGEINGAYFCNTAAIGWYPDMVRTRERLRTRVPRPLAAVGALAVHIPRLRHFDATLDGTSHKVWLVWAGNGRFGMDLAGLNERRGLSEGVLDVRLALADRRFSRLRLLTDLLRGRLDESDQLEQFVTKEPVTLRLTNRWVTVAVDAEVTRITPPVHLTPAAAYVLVRTVRPPDSPAESRSDD